jgi:hypothetical protein
VEDCSTAGSFPVEALGERSLREPGPILLVTSGFSSLDLDAVGVNTGGRLVDHERRAKLLVGCTACDANPRKLIRLGMLLVGDTGFEPVTSSVSRASGVHPQWDLLRPSTHFRGNRLTPGNCAAPLGGGLETNARSWTARVDGFRLVRS